MHTAGWVNVEADAGGGRGSKKWTERISYRRGDDGIFGEVVY